MRVDWCRMRIIPVPSSYINPLLGSLQRKQWNGEIWSILSYRVIVFLSLSSHTHMQVSQCRYRTLTSLHPSTQSRRNNPLYIFPSPRLSSCPPSGGLDDLVGKSSALDPEPLDLKSLSEPPPSLSGPMVKLGRSFGALPQAVILSFRSSVMESY